MLSSALPTHHRDDADNHAKESQRDVNSHDNRQKHWIGGRDFDSQNCSRAGRHGRYLVHLYGLFGQANRRHASSSAADSSWAAGSGSFHLRTHVMPIAPTRSNTFTARHRQPSASIMLGATAAIARVRVFAGNLDVARCALLRHKSTTAPSPPVATRRHGRPQRIGKHVGDLSTARTSASSGSSSGWFAARQCAGTPASRRSALRLSRDSVSVISGSSRDVKSA
jgi:hypothetical protein